MEKRKHCHNLLYWLYDNCPCRWDFEWIKLPMVSEPLCLSVYMYIFCDFIFVLPWHANLYIYQYLVRGEYFVVTGNVHIHVPYEPTSIASTLILLLAKVVLLSKILVGTLTIYLLTGRTMFLSFETQIESHKIWLLLRHNCGSTKEKYTN